MDILKRLNANLLTVHIEGVNVMTDALVKNVSFKNDKLEIKLKDGRLVSLLFHQPPSVC